MPSAGLIKSVLSEYGVDWAVNRALYSGKLELLKLAPFTERCFEKKTDYTKRLDIFRIDVTALKSFLQKLGDSDKNELILAADKACAGVITGFSSVVLDYGNPIDWQLNPLTGKRCDEKRRWYLIPDFDMERGDIKVTWEASRVSHFILFARAYLLTGNKKYYQAYSIQLKEWLEQNPYGFGANYKCGQECSLRMVNALLSYTVFYGCGVATDADASLLKDLIDRCYRKILSNFFYAYRCIKNNHTISELMGMIVGAWCCQDLEQLDKAFILLDGVIDEQFSTDGGYRQYSFNYQRLALQDLECILSLEERVGKRLSRKSREKIKNAAVLLYQCQDESGDLPNYGSNDGALAFPVTSCGYRDFRAVINTAYALAAGKQLYTAGKHQEELLWFSGGKPLQGFPREELARRSSQFPEAGLFTIRERRSWAMLVLNEYRSRPAHMDQLHIDLWIEGFNVLCDAGTFSYASDLGKKLLENGSHNTAFVPGRPQMNIRGPFLLYGWPNRSLETCGDRCFTGTMLSENGYCHTRSVERNGNTYVITDSLDQDFVLAFHTPCEVCIKNGKAFLSHHGQALCTISSTGTIALQRSERSLFYLQKTSTTCLQISGHRGDKTITTIQITEGEQETW